MENAIEIVDKLLEKECYVVNFLPETVPPNCNGQFLDVEYYLLNSKNTLYKR